MDHLSALIKSKQLSDHTDIAKLQDEIINNVFNGFDQMMATLLRKPDTLSVQQHEQLHRVLIADRQNKDVWYNYQSPDSSIGVCVADIPDDCWCRVATYLEHNDRVVMQRACRLFATIARQEKSFRIGGKFIRSLVDPELMRHRIVPRKKLIVQRLLSDDDEKQLSAMQMLSDFIVDDSDDSGDESPHKLHCYHSIRRYSACMLDRILSIITKHVIKNRQLQLDPDQETVGYYNPSCVRVLVFELTRMSNKKVLPIFAQVLNETSCSLSTTDSALVRQLMTAVRIYSLDHLLDVVRCGPLVPACLKILRTHKILFVPQSRRFVMGGLDLVSDILSSKLVGQHVHVKLVQLGLLDALKSVLDILSVSGDAQLITSTLNIVAKHGNVHDIHALLCDAKLYNLITETLPGYHGAKILKHIMQNQHASNCQKDQIHRLIYGPDETLENWTGKTDFSNVSSIGYLRDNGNVVAAQCVLSNSDHTKIFLDFSTSCFSEENDGLPKYIWIPVPNCRIQPPSRKLLQAPQRFQALRSNFIRLNKDFFKFIFSDVKYIFS